MNGMTCPNCREGTLTGKGSRITKRYRCKTCGFTKYASFNKKARGTTLTARKKEEKKEPKQRPKGRLFPGLEYGTDEYRRAERMRADFIRVQRNEASIQRMIKKEQKKKYNKFDTIIIQGRVFDVKTGKEFGKEEPSDMVVIKDE